MRKMRSIKLKRSSRRNKGLLELDITSLLDILVILLVFLLKSYNSSGVVFNIPKGVELPISSSSTLNTSGIVVQVSPTSIWVDDKEIINSKMKGVRYDQDGKRIVPLFDELVSKKRTIKLVEKSSPNAKKFSGVINLIIDKSIKYSYVKKLMYTSAEAGFSQFKFVVMSNAD